LSAVWVIVVQALRLLAEGGRRDACTTAVQVLLDHFDRRRSGVAHKLRLLLRLLDCAQSRQRGNSPVSQLAERVGGFPANVVWARIQGLGYILDDFVYERWR